MTTDDFIDESAAAVQALLAKLHGKPMIIPEEALRQLVKALERVASEPRPFEMPPSRG